MTGGPWLFGLDAAVVAVELLVRGAIEGAFHEGIDGKSTLDVAPAPIDFVVILLPEGANLRDAAAAIGRSQIIADGTVRTKRWSNRPANEMSPLGIAEEARDRARAVGLRARIVRRAELERMGAGMLLAVGAHGLIVDEYSELGPLDAVAYDDRNQRAFRLSSSLERPVQVRPAQAQYYFD